ncbi:hypothetical protein [Streptomyces variegatus]|uniref:hypothetical protein n=1 Tax=Streptomyces variegatus TaxID=284040 RepID=UPI003C2D0B6B
MTGRQFPVHRDFTCTDVPARRPDGRLLTPNRRPSVFARRIDLPEPLYGRVFEVHERVAADGADLVTGDVLVIAPPGGGGYGPPSPDPHQAGEEIDDLRAF